jgi:hypothetical protein
MPFDFRNLISLHSDRRHIFGDSCGRKYVGWSLCDEIALMKPKGMYIGLCNKFCTIHCIVTPSVFI